MSVFYCVMILKGLVSLDVFNGVKIVGEVMILFVVFILELLNIKNQLDQSLKSMKKQIYLNELIVEKILIRLNSLKLIS
jgi:hypothetical protein